MPKTNEHAAQSCPKGILRTPLRGAEWPRLLLFSLRLLGTVLIITALAAGALSMPGIAGAQDPLDAQIEALLAAMPLEQRVGQMFMVSVYGETVNEATASFLQTMLPGAIAMFTSNGTTPEKAAAVINAWQTIATQHGSRVPLVVSTDHEGGTVTRLTEGFTRLPWGPALGAMPPAQAEKVGALAGLELQAVGVRMNLAPVADVRAAAETPYFMEKRAFSPDPARVGGAVAAYVKGLQGVNVIGTLKHFPGHGAAGDSHAFLPVLNHTLEDLEQIDLIPFRQGIEAGADVVMVGHLSVPILDPTPGLPASLSPVIVEGLLRQKLGFQGVIMTDAMDMGAIVAGFTSPVSAVMAVRAGVDWIATGPHLPMGMQLEMRNAVLEAVRKGEIAESRITDSARRILRLKAKYGLLNWSPLDPAKATERVASPAHQEALYAIYAETVAVAFENVELLPLPADGKRIALLYPGIYPVVGRECAALDPDMQGMAYSTRPTAPEIATARQIGARADVVVIFTYNMGANPEQADLVNAVPYEKAVVVAIESPYDFEQGIFPGAYVTMFNPYPPAFRAACGVLYGQHETKGFFPAIPG